MRRIPGLLAACIGLAAGPLAAHGPSAHDAAAPADTAFGRAGDRARATRTVQIAMSDRMRFEPAVIRVKAGETVRLVAVNRGAQPHELVLGTMEELREHAELMRKFPNMEHDDPNMVRVPPGARGEIVWQFTKPGEFSYACLMPGHFEAGMVGRVVVAPQMPR
jgi:uncharacterized cupredoxin-like copper-binding protein